MRTDEAYLVDMLLAAYRIQEFVANLTEATFRQSALHQSAVIREFQVIGEAARLVTEKIKASHPEIPWPVIIGLRNRAIHEYFRLDVDIIWQIVKEDIAPLIAQLEALVPPEQNE